MVPQNIKPRKVIRNLKGRGGGGVKGEGNHGYKHSPTLFSKKKEKKKSVSPEKNDRKKLNIEFNLK